MYLRRSFWASLADISSTSLPWHIIGDSHAILKPEERWSLAPFQPTFSNDFHNFLTATGLVDIGTGNSFTWANNSQGRRYVSARLDRMVPNQAWLDAFNDPILGHLPRQVLTTTPSFSPIEPLPSKNPDLNSKRCGCPILPFLTWYNKFGQNTFLVVLF